jgi:hypothetical protein
MNEKVRSDCDMPGWAKVRGGCVGRCNTDMTLQHKEKEREARHNSIAITSPPLHSQPSLDKGGGWAARYLAFNPGRNRDPLRVGSHSSDGER